MTAFFGTEYLFREEGDFNGRMEKKMKKFGLFGLADEVDRLKSRMKDLD